MEENKLYNENCIETLKKMQSDSIDLTITSPPYDNLRDYNGYSFDFEKIATLLYDKTKDGGVVVWIVNDATINGSETCTSFKQALFFVNIGFNLHDTMIYQKHNFSNPSKNRYHQIFDYMFILSKGSPKTFNPIKDRKNVYAGKIGSWGKNTSRQKDGSFKENIKKFNSEFGQRYNIWRVNTESRPIHPAQFPESLAMDHVSSWSNEGDLVYDPFMGSGTTAVSSIRLGRNFIGSEISKEYFDKANNRIDNAKRTNTRNQVPQILGNQVI
jgi:site-specific DNA-methyltransferase (adenine-specific)